MTRIDIPLVNGPGVGSSPAAWQRFVESLEPLRPELYRSCRYLTRNAWDAEDLVQDTLARALVTLARLFQPIDHPRAWLFRIASNLWIDRQRRQREEPLSETPAIAPPLDRLALGGRAPAATPRRPPSPHARAAGPSKD